MFTPCIISFQIRCWWPPFSSTDCLISHNRPLFHPEVNFMLLIFSSTDYVFCLLFVFWLCVSLVVFFMNHCLSSLLHILYLYFHPLQYWISLLSITLLTFSSNLCKNGALFYPCHILASTQITWHSQHSMTIGSALSATLKDSQDILGFPIIVENQRASTHFFKSPFSWTCNRLERSLARKIVSWQSHWPLCHS